jgi:Polysaccharide biosynthesis enzyme WcbI
MSKIVIIGNCQAPFLESAFMMYSNAIVSRVPPVYNLTEQDQEEIEKTLSSADVIFAQRITENYPVHWLRTNDIKSKFNNVITWPNIYFDGYFPDIQYIYKPNIGKVIGPLEDYHPMLLHNGFKAGKTVSEVAKIYTDPSFFSFYQDPISKSLDALKMRESDTDVSISDFIENNISQRKLFYTVNHPKNELLFELASRIAKTANLTFNVPRFHPWALDRINLPAYPILRNSLSDFARIPEEMFIGIGRHSILAPASTSVAKVYTNFDELVESFFIFYESLYKFIDADAKK